jgi:hypothetical protein
MKKFSCLFFACLFIWKAISAQIVNIEGLIVILLIQLVGEVIMNLGFTFGKQQVKYFAFSNTAHVQYKSKKEFIFNFGKCGFIEINFKAIGK